MFIQAHYITSYAAVLLNADRSGAAKRLRFGGSMRTRVSSQSDKRKIRTAEGPNNIAELGDTAVRSKDIFVRLVHRSLIEEGFNEIDSILATLAVRDSMFHNGKTKLETKQKNALYRGEIIEEVLKTNAPVVMHPNEVDATKDIVRDILNEHAGKNPKDLHESAIDSAKEKKAVLSVMSKDCSIDVAMNGRFVSGDPEANVDAAIHVQHGFSVHREETDLDAFSCVDELTASENAGASHLNDTEITSPIIYRDIVIDVPRLVANIYGVTPSRWYEIEDPEIAREAVRRIIQLGATHLHGVKKGATAPYAAADFVLIEATENMPRGMHNAFRDPVPPRVEDAVHAFTEYLRKQDAMYEREDDRWFASTVEPNIDAKFGSVPRISLEAAEHVLPVREISQEAT